MPRPNWFLAFPIDGAFVRELPELPPRFRLFHPDDVHLTLAFLGGVGEAVAERALLELDGQLGARPLAPFDVTLGEVVPMGSPRRYTALSALLGEGRAPLTACLTELGGRLCEVALGRRPSRAAKPHVTIARPQRRATDADRAGGLAWAAGVELRNVHRRLDRIALYTWNDQRKERLFKIVAERTLPVTSP